MNQVAANIPHVTLERLREIGAAFAAHDVEGIVGAFAPEGEFRNAKGPDVWGKTYKGHAEIRAFFTSLFATASDVQWRHTAEFVCGDRAVTEWHRTATLADGTKQAWLGCDLYTFRAGMILRKDTFIKVVG